MYPRLFLARNLLKDDGVIFISIDDNEVHHLRMIMDEIFGEDNFVAEITRATGTTTGQDAKKFGSSLDYVLVYRKTDLFIPAGLPLTDKDKKRFRFDDNDGKGKYALLQLRKTGSGDRKEDRPNMFYGIKSPSGELVFPIGPTNYLSRWRVDKNTYDKFVKNNLIVWKQEEIEENEIEELEWELGFDDNGKENKTSKGVDNLSKNVPYKKSTWIPYVKYYLEGRKKRPSNLWIDIDGNKKGSLELKQLFSERIFDNPKPTQLIKRIINLSSNKEGLIIDFFAGSGTTGQAVWELNKEDDGNRKFILVQLDEPVDEKKETGKNAKKLGFDTIADISIERLKRVSQKIKAEDEGRLVKENSKLDLGFKVLSLAPSNFNLKEEFELNENKDLGELKTNYLKELGLYVDQPTIATANTLDIVYEIILKNGFSLNSKIEELRLGSNNFYKASDTENELEIHISLDTKIEDNSVEAIRTTEYMGKTFVFYDNALNDSQKINLNTFVKLQVI